MYILQPLDVDNELHILPLIVLYDFILSIRQQSLVGMPTEKKSILYQSCGLVVECPPCNRKTGV